MSLELKGVMAGAGFFAHFQIDAWNRIPGARITAIADPDFEKATTFADQWSIPNVYGSVDEMLRHEKPDFLDIVTRPDTHVELTELAAANKVHVICQKPLAPTAAESRRMIDLCDSAGVRLLVHENWRWQPWYREIKRLMDDGRVGRVFHLSFRMRTGDGRGPDPYQVQPYFKHMPRFLIFETLVHFLDTFRYLEGEIHRVWCAVQTVNPIIVGEDYAIVHVTFESGAHGLIDANRISGSVPPDVAFGELRVEGDHAMIRMAPDGNLFVTEYGHPETPHAYNRPERGYKGESVWRLQSHLLDCLRSGSPAESEGRAYLRTVELVEECYFSAEKR